MKDQNTFLHTNNKHLKIEMKNIAFLHTNNEHLKIEMKNTIPFTLTPEKIKYSGTSVTKHARDLKYCQLQNIGEINQRWPK